MPKVPQTTGQVDGKSAALDLKDNCRVVRQHLEAEEHKRLTTTQREAERGWECKRKGVDALQHARADMMRW